MKQIWSEDLYTLSHQISKWRASKKFVTPAGISNDKQRDLMLGKLMLVVTEVAEAAEAVRHHDEENFKEELADTFIRLLDICGTMDIDIMGVIHSKMEKNEERPERHGKHTSL